MNMNLGDTRLIIEACEEYGCLRNQAAYILATAYWETARTMKPVIEAFWKTEQWRKDNLRYYPWHGRGYVQLTWETNYKRAQAETGHKVHDDPALALQSKPAADILVKGSMEGWFTGKKIGDYITLQKSDYFNARRVINGRDKAREIADLALQYDEALKAEGYGEQVNLAEPTGKPAIMKSLLTSKEMMGGIVTIITAITAALQELEGWQVAVLLAVAGGYFLLNRLQARRRRER
jgi:hypothetical protein